MRTRVIIWLVFLIPSLASAEPRPFFLDGGREIIFHPPREGAEVTQVERGYGSLFTRSEEEFSQLIAEQPTVLKPPLCTRAQDRRTLVSNLQFNVSGIDITVVSLDIPEHLKKAEGLARRAVAYQHAYMDQPDPLASFAMTYDVECVPTRIHYVVDGGKQYLEYREGDNAWLDPIPVDQPSVNIESVKQLLEKQPTKPNEDFQAK